MATRFPELVLAAIASTGTGPITAWTAIPGSRTLAAAAAAGDLSNGDKVPYTIKQAGGLQWELGLGTYNSTTDTLTRSVRKRNDGTTDPLSVVNGAEFYVDLQSTEFYGFQTPIGQLAQFSVLPNETWLPAQGGTYLQGDYPELYAAMGRLYLAAVTATASGGIASGGGSQNMQGYNPSLGIWLSGYSADEYDANYEWLGSRFYAYKQTTRGGSTTVIGNSGGFNSTSVGGKWAHSPTHSIIPITSNNVYALVTNGSALGYIAPAGGYPTGGSYAFGNGKWAACNQQSAETMGGGAGGKIYHWTLGNPASTTPTVPPTAATISGTFPGSHLGVFFNEVAGKFVIPGRNGRFWTSTDAIGPWAEEGSSLFFNTSTIIISSFCVLSDGTYVVGVSSTTGGLQGLWTSNNLTDWSKVFTGNCSGLNSIGLGLGAAVLTRNSVAQSVLFNKSAEAGSPILGITSSYILSLQRDTQGWVGYNGSTGTLYTPTINLDTQFNMPTYTTTPASYIKAKS